MTDISKYKQHIYDVVGAIHEVHKELGPGLNESCYQEGLQMQLEEQGISFQRELTFHPEYHGKRMEVTYRLDFLCKENIIIECKAVSELNSNQLQILHGMILEILDILLAQVGFGEMPQHLHILGLNNNINKYSSVRVN